MTASTNIVKLSVLFLMVLPVFIWCSVKLVTWKWLEEKIQNNTQILSNIFISLFSILIIISFFGSDFIHLTLANILPPQELRFYAGFILALIISFMTIYHIRIFKKQVVLSNILIWLILLAAIIFQTTSFRIINSNLVYSNSQIVNSVWLNFDAVFYPLSQVFMGKTLLVNLPSQYGLYPEFLSPFFKLIGLNALSFTIVMGILQCTSLLLLTCFLFKTIKNGYLILLYILSACLITGFTYIIISGVNWILYYQYWPIRFIFPALSIFCFLRFAQKNNIPNTIIMSIVGAVAILWNLDTGVPALGTFWVYLCVRVIFPGNTSRKISASYLVISGVTALALWTIFILYLSIKSGQSIHLNDLIKYQKMLAVTRGGALPIPMKPHPWMVFYSRLLSKLAKS